MSATLRKDAMTETFLDLEDHVNKVAICFWRKYGGDLAVIKQDAQYHFVIAFEKFRTGKNMRMKSWIALRVNYQLLETHRAKIFRRNRLAQIPGFDLSRVAGRKVFDVEKLDLSEDADKVVRLVLQPPPEVLLSIAMAKQDIPRKLPDNLRNAVTEFLEDIGWGIERIRESFQEIRQVL